MITDEEIEEKASELVASIFAHDDGECARDDIRSALQWMRQYCGLQWRKIDPENLPKCPVLVKCGHKDKSRETHFSVCYDIFVMRDYIEDGDVFVEGRTFLGDPASNITDYIELPTWLEGK